MTYDEFLVAQELTIESQLLTLNAGDDWKHDLWDTTVRRGIRSFAIPYRTGTGLRKDCTKTVRLFLGDRYDHINQGKVHKVGGHPEVPGQMVWVEKTRLWCAVPPDPAGVLQCLALDAQAVVTPFEEWCEDLGLSTDSRKAEHDYKTCIATAQNLIRLVGVRGFADLLECTEE